MASVKLKFEQQVLLGEVAERASQLSLCSAESNGL
jgi:hypothetical protein